MSESRPTAQELGGMTVNERLVVVGSSINGTRLSDAEIGTG